MIDVITSQCANGAFPSEVDGLVDETCFVTASVVLLLDPEQHGEAVCRALDFIETCASPDVPGAYVFYPPGRPTPRRIDALPADVDDTALAWLALLHGRRREVAQARDAFRRVIATASRGLVSGRMPAWVRPHAARTWLIDAGSDNPVDLVVNANVVALAHRIGLHDHTACEGATASLLAAAQGKYLPQVFARRLAPYYADISELWFSVRRAMTLGAERLAPVLPWLAPAIHADVLACDKPLYCNDHGRPIWRSAALQQARRTFGVDFPQANHSTTGG